MCTVTLRCGGGSLLLTMNRDERYERASESAPRRIPGEPGRPAWIAPFDGGTGGTWIGVNDRGVAACLLNGYTDSDRDLIGRAGVPSRGSIVPRVLEEPQEPGPARVPGPLDFSAYPSFTLLVASADGGEVVRWSSAGAVTREPLGPGWHLLTSSSWSEPEVAAWRRRAFDSWRASGQPLVHGIPTVHLLAPAGEEASAPFMTREKSGTHSISQVRVADGAPEATLSWWPRTGKAAIDPGVPGATITIPMLVPDPDASGGEA